MRVSKCVKSFEAKERKTHDVSSRIMNKNKTQTLIRYFWLLGMLARDFRGLAFQTFNIHVMHVPRCTLLVHPFEMHAILFKRWSSDVFWDGVERDGDRVGRISLKRSTPKISSWAIIFGWNGDINSFSNGFQRQQRNPCLHTEPFDMASNWRKFHLIVLMEFSHSLVHRLFRFHFNFFVFFFHRLKSIIWT